MTTQHWIYKNKNTPITAAETATLEAIRRGKVRGKADVAHLIGVSIGYAGNILTRLHRRGLIRKRWEVIDDAAV